MAVARLGRSTHGSSETPVDVDKLPVRRLHRVRADAALLLLAMPGVLYFVVFSLRRTVR